MKKTTFTSVVLGSSLAMAAFSGALQANENPFSATSLSNGYLVASNDKAGEGKCGEGKCGGEKRAEGKCGEGKCGGDKKKEGKCGEGKCGGDK